jgi:hypothetical protein
MFEAHESLPFWNHHFPRYLGHTSLSFRHEHEGGETPHPDLVILFLDRWMVESFHTMVATINVQFPCS